jgi:peroxiredoxin Q/BCP
MAQLAVGDRAPEFAGMNQIGETISSSKFLGKKLILYFYPKDNTPGCTAESCNLSDNYQMWLSKGFDIIGVSPDPVSSHKKFADKFQFPFNLISDPDTKILQAYGVWGEKSMYGKKFMGVMRTTFIIVDGIIQEIIDKVDTKNHTDQIIKVLENK